MISKALREELERSLGERVRSSEHVRGGDINEGFRVRLESGRVVFAKANEHAPPDMFTTEALGLEFLREANAMRIPEVLATSQKLLVLSWIESGTRGHAFEERFGRSLATLHRAHPPQLGLAHDNFIGTIAQANTPKASWAEFYEHLRLRPLIERNANAGLVSASTRKRFDALLERLDQLVGPAEPPSRLHGDLWSGNVMCDHEGSPVLVDPAAYGGHREVDLAMLCLFGSPSERFFAAYEEVWPLGKGYRERLGLYQLYPLLVHVALFGGAYVMQLEATLRKYA